ncbi:MAG TPA: methyltransferase domain-containing protein, partial [Methanocorpusculum sp.]|nr:methyltransferase domain-containing protein [Methanocorpusculum sp.]
EKPYCCRARKIHPAVVDISQLELEKMMGSLIKGKVSLKNPEIEYRAVFSDGQCWFGRVIHKIDRGSYAERDPKQRAYFHPGVIMPLLARAIVNLTRVKPGELLLDPFCGTGGILLECRMLGVNAFGSDYDSEMLTGCRMNNPGGICIRADATVMPYKDETFHAVAADLPYGQSTSIGADSLDALYRGSLAEIRRVLRKDGHAVIVTHRDIRHIISEFDFELEGFFEQYVHKSLTRRIHVLK